MGSLGSGVCPMLVVFSLHLLLLQSLVHGLLLWGDPNPSSQIKANFAYERIENPFNSIIRNSPSPWHLSPKALNVSTFPLNDKPCVQIQVSINASGLPQLRGFDVKLLETSNNRFHVIRILKKKGSEVGDLLKARIRCWIVAPGQTIHVYLLTYPNYAISQHKTIQIQDQNTVPDIHYQHLAEEKRIVVSIPHSDNAYARLCYMSHTCDDLENSSKQLLNSSYSVSLPYDTILPCLCIEAFYVQPKSRRNQICPFKNNPEPYLADLIRVSAKHMLLSLNTMAVHYNSPCLQRPKVTLCRRQGGSCLDLLDASIKKDDDMNYYIGNIDIDPNLCFKFTIESQMNYTHLKCPNNNDRVWNMDVKLNSSNVLLNVSSAISASFCWAVCHKDQETSICIIVSEVYKFVMNYPGNMLLSLPWPGIDRCIKVWRSDVRFAHEYLICSFNYSHKHLGLIAIMASLLIFSVTLFFFLTFRRIWKIFTAPLWKRTILLVYSPDSSEYKTLICAFADFLQSILGCKVILDMWDMNTVSQIGMLPWFYQKRELVSQRKGKVIIVWTTLTKSMYQQWTDCQLNSFAWKDPANLFGAAMSCLTKDLEAEQEFGKLKEYTIVYFEGLCDRKDIPKSLRKISRYRLFKNLYRLVSSLQDTTCLSPSCLIKAFAKYLMRKLIRSEKSQGLQHHVEICKQRLYKEIGIEMKKMGSTSL